MLRPRARRNVDRLHRLLDIGGVPYAGWIDHRAPRTHRGPALLPSDLLDELGLALEDDHDLVSLGVAFPGTPIRCGRLDHDQSARCTWGTVFGDVAFKGCPVEAEARK